MVAANPAAVETPSGKDVTYENFPVGSWLLPSHLRPHVAVFYAFARAIDDIADSPDLTAEEKIERLDGFERALLGEGSVAKGYEKALAMRQTLETTGIPSSHCLDLLSAFRQDAVKLRYRTWEELVDYCRRSAAPVGRFLLDLHGGSRHGYGPADALCNALQVLNHLQDCQADYLALDRVYLPLDWLEEAGAGIDELNATRTSTELRSVLDRAIGGVEALLREAERLPHGLRSRRLAMESKGILAIAWTLADRLRRGDPLARRIELSKAEYLVCCMRGAAAAIFRHGT
jgi:squalene synthase HpnC